MLFFPALQSGWVEITMSSGDPMRPHKVGVVTCTHALAVWLWLLLPLGPHGHNRPPRRQHSYGAALSPLYGAH